MRRASYLVGTLGLATALTAACEMGTVPVYNPQPGGDELAGAEFMLSDSSQSARVVKLKVRTAAKASEWGEWTIRLAERSSLDLSLVAGAYLADVSVFGDDAAEDLLCGRTVRFDVVAKAKVKLQVKIFRDEKGLHGVDIAGPEREGASENDPGGGKGGGGASSGDSAEGGATAGGQGMASAGTSAGPSAGAGGSPGSAPTSAGGAGGSTDPVAGGAPGSGMAGSGPPPPGGGAAGAGGGSCPAGVTTCLPPVPPLGGTTPGPLAPESLPLVNRVDVDVSETKVKIKVRASATLGSALEYIWSGCGFAGPVLGKDSADIEVKAILAASVKVVTIFVMSQDGVVAQVKVRFTARSGGLLGGALGLGDPVTASTSVVAAAGLAAAEPICADPHARCRASCRAQAVAAGDEARARAACMLTCTLELARCCEADGD